MRKVFIRGILAVIWLGAAAVSGISGRVELCGLYCLMGALFAYTAYAEWKKGTGNTDSRIVKGGM